jgi:hypothetical protein
MSLAAWAKGWPVTDEEAKASSGVSNPPLSNAGTKYRLRICQQVSVLS